jgi:hypothetical protein
MGGWAGRVVGEVVVVAALAQSPINRTSARMPTTNRPMLRFSL